LVAGFLAAGFFAAGFFSAVAAGFLAAVARFAPIAVISICDSELR
jgi:hypothetical protein